MEFDLYYIKKNLYTKFQVIISKDDFLRCKPYFMSDWINNTDHMYNSVTEPSSVIINETKKFYKLKSSAPKVRKQAESKQDGSINS